MKTVSQAEIKVNTGGIQNGREEFSTYEVEMSISHSVYPEVSKESIIRTDETGDT